MAEQYPLAMPNGEPKDLLRQHSVVINMAMQGKLNCVNSFTLGTSTASTTVADIRVTSASVIMPMPTNSAAAAEVGGGTMYVKSRSQLSGQFVMAHSNSVNARTFEYAIIG